MANRFNRRILACRPAEQNIHWRQKLEQAGFEVLDIPMMEITELTDNESVRKIKNRILQLDTYDGIIFVSQNAVAAAFDWIENYWPQLPVNIRFYAVGKKTMEVIEQRATRIDSALSCGAIAATTCVTMDSEALLAQLTQQTEIKNKKFLICRGVGGRPLMGDELTRAGAKVDYCELYRRRLPATAVDKINQVTFDTARDVFPVFSGETLDNLITVLKQSKVANWASIPVLVPGKRVAEKARASGFAQVVAAENATDEAMLNTLIEFIS